MKIKYGKGMSPEERFATSTSYAVKVIPDYKYKYMKNYQNYLDIKYKLTH